MLRFFLILMFVMGEVRLTIDEPVGGILHFRFPNQREITQTLLRFQEYYESPEFRDKVFSLKEFMAWYIANSPQGREHGEFTYYSDWNGFNFPSRVLVPFFEGAFDPLSVKENDFMELLRDRHESGQRFYVIGTHAEHPFSASVLKHEIAHGLFYTSEAYSERVLEVLQDVPPALRERMNTYLQNSGGYHAEVWEDETHAHFLASQDKLSKAGFDLAEIEPFRTRIDAVYLEFGPKQGAV